MEVIIYSKTICPNCHKAKAFLSANGIVYTEVNLDDDAARAEFYEKCGSGVRSVPQIFVDGVRIGGFNELVTSDILERSGASNFDEDF